MESITITEQKEALRRAIRALPTPDWTPLLARFRALPEVASAQSLLLFYGVGREPDTRALIAELIAEGKTVALPVVLPGRCMEARVVRGSDDLEPGPLNIPAPRKGCPVLPKEQIDLILVPNLCCDLEGVRLGQGGGYYDRYLADYRGTTVALCPSNLVQARVPRDGHDQGVGVVVTEARVLVN